MANLLPAIALWLADYHLLAVALLLGVTIATALLRQPAQRLALANATLAGLAAMALLSALPGWSLVHLLNEPAPQPELRELIPLRTEPVRRPATQLIPTENIETLRTSAPSDSKVVYQLAPPQPAPSPAFSTWLAAICAIYAAGSAAVAIWLLAGAILAHRVRRQARPAPPELEELLREVCGEGTRVPQLLLSTHIAAPAALGLRRPAILLPPSTLPLPPSHLLPILAHEWAHLQHRDLHTLAASRLLLILLWPQPLFWLLRRTIRLDQETLADAAAADRAGRLDYAQQLLAWARTANTQRPPRLAGAVGLWEGPSQLKRRIALLLNEQFAVMRSCSTAWRRVCIASLAVAAVALSLVTLQPSPVAGDDEAPLAASTVGAPAKTSPLPVPEGFTKISGAIITEEGKPATASGWLYSDSTTGMNSYTSAEGKFTDKWEAKIHNGTVWLIYFPDDFAPAWAGPLQARGKDLNDVSLVLKPGVTIPIEVVDEAGAPVAGANILAVPIIGDNANGPNVERLTNDQGRYEFQHVAAVPYKIEVTAPKFQALRVPSVEMDGAQPLKLTLQRAEPTTGVVENRDGTPAAGALLRFRAEVRKGNANSGGPGYGPVDATTDAQGRFTLDNLATGSSYLYVIETADGARAWLPDVTAGRGGFACSVPPRHDLRGRVVGDINSLPQRGGKPFVSVRQRRQFVNYGDLVEGDAFITPTADGGEFTYKGLLPGEVEIAAGEFKTTVAVNEQGVTEAVLTVAPKSALAGFTKISGAIVNEDGSPATVASSLHYISSRPGSSHGGKVDLTANTFSVDVPVGTIWLAYFAEGMAPAWVGPLQAEDQAIDEVTLRLSPGFNVPVEVFDEQGKPVFKATVSAWPTFGGTGLPGPQGQTDERGRWTFPHMAKLPYAMTVTAPTYVPLRIPAMEFQPDKPARFTLTLAQPTTGVIQNADGTPAAGARLQRWNESGPGGSRSQFGVVATADEQGRFTLDQLAPESTYLFIVETQSKALAWSPEITAGMRDVVIRVPQRRDLKGRVVGDMNALPHRDGQPFVRVRQPLNYEFKGVRYSEGYPSNDVFITPTAGGGFTYQGLLPGEVEIAAGEFKTTVTVNEQGATEAVVQVAAAAATPAETTAEPSTNASPLQATDAGDAIMFARGIRSRPDAVEPNVIQGVCIDDQNKPLAGVTVDLYRGHPFHLPQELVASTKTNAQGEYRCDDVVDIAKTYPNGRIPTTSHSGAPMFVWVARQPGRVSRESAAMVSEAASRGQTVDLLMPAAASLTGVVRNAAGQPIEGALIARRARMAIASDFATARSDADGKFAVDDLPPYDTQAEAERQRDQHQQQGVLAATEGATATLMFSADAQLFTATHPDYQFKNLPLTDIPGEIEIVLEPAARIAGRVVLADGAPAAGVNVLVQNSLPKNGDWGMIDYDQYEMEREYQAAVKTDADGHFEVSSLQPGKFDLWVEAPSWLNAGQGEVEVTAGQTTSVPDLKLTKGGTIKVQALHSGVNKPLNHIAGARAVAQVLMKDQIGRQHPVEQRVPLAADGTFTLASLPGTAMVRLDAIEVDDDVRWLPASNEYKDQVIVDVKAGETVEAKLPVKEVTPPNAIFKPVQPQGQSTSDATLQMVPAVGPVATPIPSTTGAQIAPAPASPSGAVAETRHQTVGMGTFVAVAAKPAEPSTENANKLDIKVVDEQGAPLAGVEALIHRAPPHNAPGKPVLLRTLATDAEGKLLVSDPVSAADVALFEKIIADGGFLGGLEGGYLIALRRPGLATASIFQAAGPLGLYGANRTIKMRPAAKLSGQVTDPAGKPVAGAKIIAGGDLFGGIAIEGVNAAVSDAVGRYEFADRAAFNRIEANKQQNQFLAASLSVAGENKPPGPPAAEDPSVNSVSDLLVSHPDYAVTRVEGGDVPGVVDVQLLPAASITGRVIHHSSGAPAAGVIVHADEFPEARQIGMETEFRPRHSAVTTTDASGAYRIANLPAGRYDVWADSGAKEMSDAPWVSRGHRRIEASPGGEPAQAPDLVVGPPAVVQVQLVDAESGKPVELPAGAKVTIAAERIDGPRLQIIPQQRAPASTDGRFDIRLLPGQTRVFLFVHEGGLGSRAIWQMDDDVRSTGEVFDVKFGETTSATMPVLPTERVEELRERDMAAYKLMEEKKYAEAIAAFTALIADFPKNHFGVLQHRGHAHKRLGDYTAALADFEASLKLAPANAGTKLWVAELLATTPVDADRDSRRGLEYAEQLVADARAPGVNPQWLASVLDIQAAAHADLGNFEKAIEIEQEAIQIGNQLQRKQMESRLELYKAKKPYRLSAPAP